MEDLYFENELRNRERKRIEEGIKEYRIYFNSGNKMSELTKHIYQEFDEILDVYYRRKFGDAKEYDEIYEMTEMFKQQLTDDRLFEMYNNHKFSEEEIEYIKLVEISSTWRGEKSFDIDAKYAITDILLRTKIIEQFGEDALEVFRDVIQRELPKTERYRKTENHYTQLLSDKPYGENVHDELEINIEEKSKSFFNQAINCGGYALKVDRCVYPTGDDNFSQSVSSLLDKFPFIRLLGDTQLEDDEYIVIYRAPQGKNTGHHFIRIDSDATVREKDANGEPRIFENWGTLNDEPEAVFAVKKEHKIFDYSTDDINLKNNNGLDFDGSVAQAVRERKNIFSYHNHDFHLKKTKQDEVVITTNDGEIVAEVIIEGDECLVEVIEEKKSFVENFSGKVAPEIVNGKLVNYEQFKGNRVVTTDSEGR